MKLRKRWFALAILLVLLAVPSALLLSETALRFAVAQVEQRIPGLTVEGVRGRLLTGISVDRAVWRDADGHEVILTEFRTEWRALPALMGSLRVNVLSADTVTVNLPTERAPGPGGKTRVDARELPVTINISAINIRRFVLTLAGEQLLVVDAIAGQNLNAHGRTAALGGLHAEWMLTLPGVQPITGTLAVEDAVRNRIPMVLTTSDGSLTLEADLTNLGTDLRVDARAHLKGLEPSQWIPEAPAIVLDGAVSLRGAIEDMVIAGDLALALPDGPTLELDTELAWGRQLLRVRQIEVGVSGTDARFTGEGIYDWSETLPSARIRGNWTAIRWPLTGESDWVVRSDAGSLQAILDGATLALNINGALGDDEDGTAVAEGLLAWPIDPDDIRGRADVRWQSLQIADINSPEGHLQLTGSYEGWQAKLERITGTLREREFEFAGDVAGRGTSVERVDLTAAVAEATAIIRGEVGEELALDWSLRIPDVRELIPNGLGMFRAEGTARGSITAPRISYTVESDRFRIDAISIDRLRGQGIVDLRDGGSSRAELQARKVTAAGQLVDELLLSLEGPTSALAINASLRADDISIDLGAEGRWIDAALNGRLVRATVEREGFGAWALQEPVGLIAGLSAITLENACWLQSGEDHRVCASAAVRDRAGDINLQLNGLPLHALQVWLPSGFIFEGAINGTAAVTLAGANTPQVTMELAVTEGAWKQPTPDGIVALVAWRSVGLTGSVTEGDLNGAFRFELADGGDLNATLRLPIADTEQGERTSRPLMANFRGAFTDFDLIPALIPEVGSVNGAFRADLTIEGTLDNPTFRGDFVIDDGVMTLPRLGLRLTEMEFELDGGMELLAVRAQTRSGEGVMSVTGIFAVRDGKLIGEARLEGEDFQASAIPEARVTISPRIDIVLQGHTVRVDGALVVPQAHVAPRDLTGIVQRSADEVLIDDELEDGDGENWRVHTRIRLTLGDASFDGFGLNGKVTGAMTLIDEPGQVTTATGELQIQDGRYAAWGQQLEIERGRLLFTGGPVTTPGLDIRAVRRPRDVMVGVNVRGTLREPEMRLISDPPMQQAELLSWLMLGMPLAQTTGAEQQILDRTARSASLAGGELLARELGRRLGISEIGIEHGMGPDDAALVIGHYFSPRIYVAYGIGLFEATNSLRLRFHLNRQWSIEVETSEEASSTDLKYTIER